LPEGGVEGDMITYLNCVVKTVSLVDVIKLRLMIWLPPSRYCFFNRCFGYHTLCLLAFSGRPPFFPFWREALALRLLLIEPSATAAGFLFIVFDLV
jgi:hypothetical protein